MNWGWLPMVWCVVGIWDYSVVCFDQVGACEDDAYETYLDCFNDCWTTSCTEVWEYEDDLEICWDIEMERIDAC